MKSDLLPLKTERLIIKKTSLDDIDLILKMDQQEITQKYLGGIKNKTKEERLEFLNNKKDSLTVCLKDGTPIGFIELSINEYDNSAELSYIFDSDYSNNGYCTESCTELLNIGFNKLGIKKIYADTVKGNNSSIRVLEKLNFKYKGLSKRDNLTYIEYYILKEDYNN